MAEERTHAFDPLDMNNYRIEKLPKMQKSGLPQLSLAFPVAMLIEHVYVLPFNSKPAALLYNTNQYSWSDTFRFGIVMMVISWLLILVWGETVLHWLGYTPLLF